MPLGESGVRRVGRPYITWGLVIINVAVFIILFTQGPETFNWAIQTFGMKPRDLFLGRNMYTVVTSMFLHGSLSHLMGNMLYLLVFGSSVESRLGKIRYLVMYFASGILASIIHSLIELLFSEPIVIYGPLGYSVIDPLSIPAVGASGAISGILGAYLLLFPNVTLNVFTTIGFFPLVVRVPAIVFIGSWFFYQLYLGILSLALPIPYFSGVAFWAHIGGFLGGIFLVPLVGGRRRKLKVRTDIMGRRWYEIPVE